jgi:cytochrome c oxidase subunit 2
MRRCARTRSSCRRPPSTSGCSRRAARRARRTPRSPASRFSGESVFKEQPCGSCHTLSAAGAKGTVGPDLDKSAEYAQQAGEPVEDFVRESITDPNAYVEQGFPKGVMPPFDLPKDKLDALVQYIVQSSKKG